MSDLRVLVVGASIAGPATAYWLAKAGANVTVIERWPQLRDGGHNIDLRTTGITVMRKMPGMEDAVRAKKVDVAALAFVDNNGTEFAKFESSGTTDQQTLLSEYEIFRGDLSRILYDLTKDNAAIQYVFGEQVTALRYPRDVQDGPVTVDFKNGRPSEEFDLVVACDGSTSRTRAIGLDCGPRDHTNAVNQWAAYYSIPGDLLNGRNVGLAHSTVGGLFYAMIYDAAGKKTRVGLMSMQGKGISDAYQPIREATKQGDGALRKAVADHFAGTSWRIPELLDGLADSKDLYTTNIVQVKAPHLHRKRFVMVGDAGYAPGPTGAGTSLALAGAYVLAGEICSHDGNLEAGLAAYEERMRPIIKDMQQIPPGIQWIMAPQTAWGLRVRNVVLGFVTWLMRFGSLFSWFGGWFAASLGKDKYGLPDYPWRS